MKKILKLFLVFLYILFLFTNNTCNASYVSSYKKTSIIENAKQENSVLLNFDIINDTSIVAMDV